MRKEAVISKFAPNMASLPALRCLRLVNNDIETLKELSFLIDSLGRGVSALEHLIVKDSPICSSAGLLRHFVCAILPNLKSFNEAEISILERAESIKMIAPVLKVQDLAISQHYFGQAPSQSDGAADLSSQQPGSRVGNVSSMRLRPTQTAPSKRPSASMGNRSAVTAESYEASIDQLVSEISASASNSKVKEKWEAALAKAVHQIFKESVFNLTKS